LLDGARHFAQHVFAARLEPYARVGAVVIGADHPGNRRQQRDHRAARRLDTQAHAQRRTQPAGKTLRRILGEDAPLVEYDDAAAESMSRGRREDSMPFSLATVRRYTETDRSG